MSWAAVTIACSPEPHEPVDGERGHAERAADLEPDVARQVGVGARGLNHVSHHDVVHLIRADPAPLERTTGGVHAELDSVEILERAAEIAERRSRAAQDDDVLVRDRIVHSRSLPDTRRPSGVLLVVRR